METELLNEIETFLSLTDMSAAAFGEEALADRKFVYELRGGRRVFSTTSDKCRAYMKEYAARRSAAKAQAGDTPH